MTKIEALQKTIFNLENDVYEYNWENVDTCNCGVLARTILGGKKPNETGYLYSPVTKGYVTEFASRAFCMTTSLPLPLVFQSLQDAGFTYQDLLELENLGNDKVLSAMGYGSYRNHTGDYNVINFHDENFKNGRGIKKFLIQYLKAWVELLIEEQTTTQPVQTPAIEAPAVIPKVIEKTVYVSVPTSITEQAKELLLS